jgi:hypothetical protein
MRARIGRSPARRTRLAARDQARRLSHSRLEKWRCIQVWSRRGADFTYRLPAIAEAVGSLNVDRALIDGEAVVLRDDGRSDFGALLTKRGGAQASFVALRPFVSRHVSETTYLFLG